MFSTLVLGASKGTGVGRVSNLLNVATIPVILVLMREICTSVVFHKLVEKIRLGIHRLGLEGTLFPDNVLADEKILDFRLS